MSSGIYSLTKTGMNYNITLIFSAHCKKLGYEKQKMKK